MKTSNLLLTGATLQPANTQHPSIPGAAPMDRAQLGPDPTRKAQPRNCRIRGTANPQLTDDHVDVAKQTTPPASTTPARVFWAQIRLSRPRSGPQEELVEVKPPSRPQCCPHSHHERRITVETRGRRPSALAPPPATRRLGRRTAPAGDPRVRGRRAVADGSEGSGGRERRARWRWRSPVSPPWE
jgi:hypothetical protein